MIRPTKETEANLRNAMDEKDPILLRSIIVTAGNISLLEAQRAFDFVLDGGDPYKILQVRNPDFVFITDESRWTKEYFFEHSQKMMRNFSREAFEHYLEVGAKVFPDKVNPRSIAAETPKSETPSRKKRIFLGNKYVLMIGAVVIGLILFGILILSSADN